MGISLMRYQEISGDIGDFGFCHCKSCRKASGSAHAANVGILRDNFNLKDPKKRIKEFESSPGKFRVFCSQCGSPLFAYLSNSSDVVRIRLGSLDTEFSNKPKAHTFVCHSAKWDILDEETPAFPEWAPRSILVQLGSKQPKT